MDEEIIELPPHWVECPEMGTLIQNLIYPFKTIVDERYNDLVPLRKRFNVYKINKFIKENSVQLIIDLTYENIYYNPRRLRKTEYIKFFEKGFYGIPNLSTIKKFIKIITNFVENNNDRKIGIHCTNGFNMTGFMIASYLVTTQLMGLSYALAVFANSRPPGIYDKEYIYKLMSIYGILADIIIPDVPDWDKDRTEIVKRKRKAREKQKLEIESCPKHSLSKKKSKCSTKPIEPPFITEKEMNSETFIPEVNDSFFARNDVDSSDILSIQKMSLPFSLNTSENILNKENIKDKTKLFVPTVNDSLFSDNVDSSDESLSSRLSKKESISVKEIKEIGESKDINTKDFKDITNPQVTLITATVNDHRLKSTTVSRNYHSIFSDSEDSEDHYDQPISTRLRKNVFSDTSIEEKKVLLISTNDLKQISEIKETNAKDSKGNIYQQIPLITTTVKEHELKSHLLGDVKDVIISEDIDLLKKTITFDLNPNNYIMENDHFTYNISSPSIVYSSIVERALQNTPKFYIISQLIQPVKDFGAVEDLRNKVRNILKTTIYGFVGIKYTNLTSKHLLSFIKKSYLNTSITDGKRYLLFVVAKNEIFLIDENNWFYKVSKLQFPRLDNVKKSIKNSIFDGEFVIKRNNDYVYMISNIYAFQGKKYEENNFLRRMTFLKKIIIEARNNLDKVILKMQPFNIELKKYSKPEDLPNVWDGINKESDYKTVGIAFYPFVHRLHNCLTTKIIYLWQDEKFKTVPFKLKSQLEQDGVTTVGNLFIRGSNVPYETITNITPFEVKEYENKIVKCHLNIFSNKWTIVEEEKTRKTAISKLEIEELVEDIKQPVSFDDLKQ